ncbi:hypothetical protein AB0I72_05410 [Nocardiopsis sp. NPDC049922]|uniref:hypothetical protein n=1 Tax=Nocardiopsis sp. NPDC049922 TaxID=3155157 RepID=UPI0033E13A05
MTRENEMAERWATKEAIIRAREELEAAHTGWRRPAAYGIGVERDGGTVFGLTNAGGNHLPAVVLGRTLGHVSGTATHRMTVEQLDAAIAGLAPAEACPDFDHPNLHHWRELRAEVAEKGGQLVAVFVGDLADPPVDDHDAAFRAALA